MSKKITILIFLLAFIEGGAVMCVELCSAKLLSPFFGTSIYIWAAVLGITLTALMCGYYLGGYISSKNKKRETLFWLMLVAGFFVTLTPIISDYVLPVTINFNLIVGAISSLMCFLFIPLLLFGSISPLIINLLTNNAKDSGKQSGTVYAISTFGGIITTFLVGFYTLPQFGITKTLYVYGLCVMAIAIYLFISTRTFKTPISLFLLIAILSFNFQNRFSNQKIIYQSEGILGEIKVVDEILKNYTTNTSKEYRELMVNNMPQTIMDKQNPNTSYWEYVDILMNNTNQYLKGKNVLLLGLGGGTLYKQLILNQLDVDVVEIDERIEKIAKKYFGINPNAKIYIDDARHYINTTPKKYDLVIYDLYNSETPPIHLMTQEAFREIYSKLTPDGILIINYYGYITGNKGKGARSIYKTLLKEKFHLRLTTTSGGEANRNLLFICSKNKIVKQKSNTSIAITKGEINLNDAIVLTDDKPILEHLYVNAALSWRKDYNVITTKHFLKNHTLNE